MHRTAFFLPAVLISCTAIITPLIAQTKPGRVNLDDVIRESIAPDRSKAYLHFAMAKLREKEDDLDAAESEIRQAMALDPKSTLLRSEAAEFFLRMRKVQEAINLSKGAIELDANNVDAHFLLGNIYSFIAGQPDFKVTLQDAIAEYQAVIRIDPQHPLGQFRLGQLYLRDQEPRKAIEALEEFNKRTGGFEESYYFLSLAYESVDRIDDAIQAAQKAMAEESSPRVMELLANLLNKAGRSKDAIDIFRNILTGEEHNVEVKKRLASALIATNKYDEAAKLLEEVCSADGEDLASRLDLGKAYLGLRKFDKSRDAFESILKQNATDIGAKFYLAFTFEEMGSTEKAIQAFRQLLDETFKPNGKYTPQAFDDRILFRRHIAFIYQGNGDFEKAILEFREILTEQERPENYRTLINALRLARKNDETLKLSLEAVKKFPEDKYLALGNCQLIAELENFGKGEKLARELLLKNGADVDYYITLSQIYMQAKKFNQAEEILKKALDATKGNEATVKFQLGAVYERARRFEQAETQFMDLIKDDPMNATALNYLGYMWADRGIRLEEALGYVRKAVELDPGNGAYLDSLGWVYFKMNQLPEAEKFLNEAVRRVRNDPTIHEHLGDLYFKRGQYEKAEGAWQQAIAHGTEDEEIDKVKGKLDRLKKMSRNRE
jgi:tetratricopeptide (TPR) repeat protein